MEDFSLTQEELADNVRWEDEPIQSEQAASRNGKGTAPSRKVLTKKPKKTAKGSKRGAVERDIDDIMGILGKRKEGAGTEDGGGKENRIGNADAADDGTQGVDAAESQCTVLSTADTLASCTSGSITEVRPGAPVGSAVRALHDGCTQELPSDLPPSNAHGIHGTTQMLAATQVWDEGCPSASTGPSDNSNRGSSGGGAAGLPPASGTGTAKHTQVEAVLAKVNGTAEHVPNAPTGAPTVPTVAPSQTVGPQDTGGNPFAKRTNSIPGPIVATSGTGVQALSQNPFAYKAGATSGPHIRPVPNLTQPRQGTFARNSTMLSEAPVAPPLKNNQINMQRAAPSLGTGPATQHAQLQHPARIPSSTGQVPGISRDATQRGIAAPGVHTVTAMSNSVTAGARVTAGNPTLSATALPPNPFARPIGPAATGTSLHHLPSVAPPQRLAQQGVPIRQPLPGVGATVGASLASVAAVLAPAANPFAPGAPPTATLRQSQQAAAPSLAHPPAPTLAPAVEDSIELSEEALAHIMALERAALVQAGSNIQNTHKAAAPVSQQNQRASGAKEFCEADLAHLVTLAEGAATTSDTARPLAVAVMSTSCAIPPTGQPMPAAAVVPPPGVQDDDFALSEEALAQLMELERQALSGHQGPALSQPIVSATEVVADTSATRQPPLPPPPLPPLLCMRLVALDVVDNYTTRTREVRAYQPGRAVSSQQLGESSKRGSSSAVTDIIAVELSGDWYNCQILSGDVFHVVDLSPADAGAPTPQAAASRPSVFTDLTTLGTIRVTDQCGLLVVHPDVLISPTKVAESRSCMRRAVLTDRIRSFGDISAPAVLGNLKHAFIEALTECALSLLSDSTSELPLRDLRVALNQTEIGRLTEQAKSGLLEDLYLVGVTDEVVAAELRAIVEPTLTWVHNMHYKGLQILMQQGNKPGGRDDVFLSGVESNEESVCCAVLGMKGQIDLVARARIVPLQDRSTGAGNLSAAQLRQVGESALAVEIKTGKWRASTAIGHRAQVMLYVLLTTVRDRAGASRAAQCVKSCPSHGVILYISPEELKLDLISPSWTDMRALMLSRNSLAGYIRDAAVGVSSSSVAKTPLPPLLREVHECQYCYQAAECAVHHAGLEGGTAASSGMKDLFSYILKDVTPTQLRYYKQWDGLLNLEYAATQGVEGGLCSDENDRCISDLALLSCEKVAGTDSCIVTFSRPPMPGAELEESAETATADALASISVNDRVQISATHLGRASSAPMASDNSTTGDRDIEDLCLAPFRSQSRRLMDSEVNICAGTVLEVSAETVLVQVSEDPKRLRRAYMTAPGSKRKGAPTPVRFSITKDEISINITTMRSNLLALYVDPFQPKAYQQHKAREVGLRKSQSATTGTASNAATRVPNVAYRSTSTSSLASMASVTTSSSVNGQAETPSAPSHNVRWRQLIVDLAAPVFRAPVAQQDDLMLAKPAQMHPAVFQQALRILQQYRQRQASSDALVLSPQQLAQLGVTSPIAPPVGSAGVICVTRGAGGELHIFGGLAVYPGCDPLQLKEEFKTLNVGQAAAVRKILLSEDYALLLGLPGTGKTSTLSLVIRLMISRGQKVLLTSFTHSAVDHLVTKLIEAGMRAEQLLRIGAKTSVQPAVHKYLLEERRSGTSVAALQKVCSSVRLVACTALAAARSKLVRSLGMDCCLMDEAGQIAQPTALGAVLCARSAVLVGDDYQLPPLVVSLEAQMNGMSVSLFKRFMEAHPAAVCSLTIQYRMNAEIMSVCNTLIYEHRMLCALSAIASAVLHLPRHHLVPSPRTAGTSATTTMGARADWLYRTLLPRPAVVFLNTDDLACHLTALMLEAETAGGGTAGSGRRDSITSESEAAIVRDIVVGLRAGGCDLLQVGIICPFRAQVSLIAASLQGALSQEDCAAVEVSTVDKYQGRDKDVIVLSTVKCCLDGKESVGNLLRDWRRINVAVTRAKKKLVVVGSVAVMQQVPVLKQFTHLCQQRGWTIDLPPDAVGMY